MEEITIDFYVIPALVDTMEHGVKDGVRYKISHSSNIPYSTALDFVHKMFNSTRVS